MSTSSAITLAINVLEALPSLVTAGEEAAQLITSTVGALKVMRAQNRDPLPSEWDAIHGQIAAFTAALAAPEAEQPEPAGAPVEAEAGQADEVAVDHEAPVAQD